ncbi:MAG: sialidase family protein [Gemmatimonadota bacterium]|nr:sialidase family protein [Gemmatimonadota bacterium]
MIRSATTRSEIALAIACGALATACAGEPGAQDDVSPASLTLTQVEFARPAKSGEPHLLATSDGGALLTWLEPVGGDVWAFRLARRGVEGWSEPTTIRESDAFFVNWADFPSSVEMDDGTIVVLWLERVADAPYAYHVMLSLSDDDGASWSDPIRLHDDTSPTEHGFVSMTPWEGGAAITWLDGRAMYDPDGEADGGHGGGAGGAMSARFRTLAPDGALGAEVLLDGRTCECCQTALAASSRGLVAAYRDRSETEIRDIAVVRSLGETWSPPVPIAENGWEINGCPVNGPQLSARGADVVGAWYTGVGDAPQAYVAFSSDAGESFGPPVRIDEGLPIGRVDVEWIDDGRAVVTWVEGNDGGARVMARLVAADEGLEAPVTVTETTVERASGFPRIARVGSEVLVVWTVPGDEGGIRVRGIRIE